MIIIRLSIDQDQIGFDMAITVIDPIARKRMIEAVTRRRLINN